MYFDLYKAFLVYKCDERQETNFNGKTEFTPRYERTLKRSIILSLFEYSTIHFLGGVRCPVKYSLL